MGPQASSAPSDPTVVITYDSQLMEGFLQTTNIQVDPPGLSPSPISVFMNSQGLSEALTIQGGYLYHVCASRSAIPFASATNAMVEDRFDGRANSRWQH